MGKTVAEKKIENHLDYCYTEPVRDPLWGNIMLSPELKNILSSPAIQKLGKIKQLGPTYHVYPGATHTRLSHSIGVFHIAKRIIRKLLAHENCPELSKEGVVSFLCASLLHDLGHYPFAHSLKELPVLDHEELTGRYLSEGVLYRLIKKELKIDPLIAAAIVDKSITSGINDEILFFRNILSGVLDPDKLDYLNRDAYFCGVPYGTQDIDFVINTIVPHEKTGIAVTSAGIPSVENLLFSKYLMYKAVYWHKTVRSATAMIKKALYQGLEDKKIDPEELYNLDDESIFQKYRDSSYPPFTLINMVSRRELYKTVYEESFDISCKAQKQLLSLKTRLKKEKEISVFLKNQDSSIFTEESVIIDIPEKISFEVSLPVINNSSKADFTETDFTESDSVFSKPVIKGFTENLRKIRVFIPPKAAQSIRDSEKTARQIKELIGS